MRLLCRNLLQVTSVVACLFFTPSAHAQESVTDYFFPTDKEFLLRCSQYDNRLGSGYKSYVYKDGELITWPKAPKELRYPSGWIEYKYPQGSPRIDKIEIKGNIIKSIETQEVIYTKTNRRERELTGNQWRLLVLPEEGKTTRWTEHLFISEADSGPDIVYKCSARFTYLSSGNNIPFKVIRIDKRATDSSTTNLYYWAKGRGLVLVCSYDSSTKNHRIKECAEGVNAWELSKADVDNIINERIKEKALHEFQDSLRRNPEYLKNVSPTVHHKVDSLIIRSFSELVARAYGTCYLEHGTLWCKLTLSSEGISLKQEYRSSTPLHPPYKKQWIADTREKVTQYLETCTQPMSRLVVEPVSGEQCSTFVEQEFLYAVSEPKDLYINIRRKKGKWIPSNISDPVSWYPFMDTAAMLMEQVSGKANKYNLHVVNVKMDNVDNLYLVRRNSSGEVEKVFLGQR